MEQQQTERITYGLDRIGEAYAVRMAVFVEEQGFSAELEKDAQDAEAYHLVLFDGAAPVATTRFFPVSGGAFRIGRVAVRKEYRGRNLGLRLMERSEEEIRRLGGTSIRVSAQKQAVGFYEKAGYCAHGAFYSEEGCPHRDMTKAL